MYVCLKSVGIVAGGTPIKSARLDSLLFVNLATGVEWPATASKEKHAGSCQVQPSVSAANLFSRSRWWCGITLGLLLPRCSTDKLQTLALSRCLTGILWQCHLKIPEWVTRRIDRKALPLSTLKQWWCGNASGSMWWYSSSSSQWSQ